MKRNSQTRFLKKQDPTICCLQETHFKTTLQDGLEVKESENIPSWSGYISNRQNRLQHKEGHLFHNKKFLILQKDITNLCTHSVREL